MAAATELEYLEGRERHARRMASTAHDAHTRDIHLELAALYAARLVALGRGVCSAEAEAQVAEMA